MFIRGRKRRQSRLVADPRCQRIDDPGMGGGGGGGGNAPVDPPAGTQAPPPPPAGTQAPPAPAGTQAPPASGAHVHTLSDREFKGIKDEARTQGERKAREELVAAQNAEAKRLGFSNYEDLIAKAPGLKAQAERATALEADKVALERQKAEAEAQVVATREQAKVREVALMAACHDPDYFETLVHREREKLPAEQRAAFDVAAFAVKLKTEKPHLFGAESRPATTGVSSNAPPPPAAGGGGGAGGFDARTASKQEVEKRRNSIMNGRGSSATN